MANEWSEVACVEEAWTAEEDYDEEFGLLTARVTLRCNYEDRHELAKDVCGNRRPWPKGGFGIVPQAAQAGIRMAQDAGQTSLTGASMSSRTALVTFTYTTKNIDIVTESIEPVVDFIRLDHRDFVWAGPAGENVTEEEAPGKLYRLINFVRTQMYVQPPLPMSMLSLIGTVNDAPIVSTLLDGFTFDNETMLYCPPTINRKITSLGAQQYDTVKKWTFNPNGWNTYYRASQDAFIKMYVQRSGEVFNSYTLADHSVLRD